MTQHRKLDSAVPTGSPMVEAAAVQSAAESQRLAIHHTIEIYAAVTLGSLIGSVMRALASVLIHDCCGGNFPWGTLFVNVTGSFFIGFYAALTGPDGRVLAGPRQRQFVMTGFCGGYTTFSMFSLETLRLLQAGNLSEAGLNLVVSIISWLGAAWLGHIFATGLNRLKGS